MEIKIKKEKQELPIKNTAISRIFSYKYNINDHDNTLNEVLDSQASIEVDKLPIIIDPKCRIGIEVEVENIPSFNDNIMYSWQLHDDSSLRNNGREFVSFPIYGQQIPLSLALLFTNILPIGYDFSKRTSIHIHMNVRNMTPEQVAAFVCLFIVFEKLLYRFVGNNRDKNIFCVPLYETQISNYILEAMNCGFSNVRWYKYAGLNLLPITTQGSIELRQLHGTDDVSKICTWINLLQRIRLHAMSRSLDDILNEIRDLNTNSQYDFFVQKIFLSEARFLSFYSLVNDMESGVTCVKECTLNNKFHQLVLSKIVIESELVSTIIKIQNKNRIGKNALSATPTEQDVGFISVTSTIARPENEQTYLNNNWTISDGPVEVVLSPQEIRR